MFAINLLIWLTWLPNTEADLAGYRLYFRPIGMQQYECVWEGAETLAHVDTGDGDFVVRAFDLAGNESKSSNVVHYRRCDLDGDGDCDGLDLSLFGRSFGL